eukprot:362306-Chlamydomonas_euryale.AAC.3
MLQGNSASRSALSRGATRRGACACGLCITPVFGCPLGTESTNRRDRQAGSRRLRATRSRCARSKFNDGPGCFDHAVCAGFPRARPTAARQASRSVRRLRGAAPIRSSLGSTQGCTLCLRGTSLRLYGKSESRRRSCVGAAGAKPVRDASMDISLLFPRICLDRGKA